MDRKDFLNSIGMSAAAFALINCIGCKKSTELTTETLGPTGINFTLDLGLAANSALMKNGGSLISNGIIVAKTNLGSFIAVQRSCTHENYSLTYQSSNKRFYCPNHGATFSETGSVTNGPASSSLTAYKTELTGNLLRIYS